MAPSRPTPNNRRAAGRALAALPSSVQQIAADQWQVQSQSGRAPYLVTIHRNLDGEEYGECSCPDQFYRGTTCKHLHAVADSRAALAYCIEKAVAGGLEALRTRLLRALLGWLPEERAAAFRIVWIASETILARYIALQPTAPRT